MATSVPYGIGSARSRYISDGYRKYWYLRSALRWLSIVAAITSLIVYGIVYHDWVEYKNGHVMNLGSLFFIVAVSDLLPILL
jgi:hypothetical protein